MSRELVERCDICDREVSDVLRDHDPQSLRSVGAGYIEVRRRVWRFGPWPRLWHREDRGFEIVCDWCLDEIRERVRASEEPA